MPHRFDLTRNWIFHLDERRYDTTLERVAPTESEIHETIARTVLREIGAPERLIRHGDLVAEAAEEILEVVMSLVAVDAQLVRLGARLHDAGKALHPHELERPGRAHEEDGGALLLRHGVDPRVARMCHTHARWRETPDATLEDLLVALADSLWKGRRDDELEQRVVDVIATHAGKGRWDIFTPLDNAFERIAAGSQNRLERSRG